MRRCSLLLGALLVSLAVLHQQAIPSPAATFPAGWNLVSGPEGSHLRGAEGSLYTIQPRDSAYEVVPADAALKAGWGYWANFPGGGSLDAAADSPLYRVTAPPDEWVMIGNPSATASAAVTGADSVLTYTPAGGYASVTAIPPGQGAWAVALSQDAPIVVSPTQPPPGSPTAAPAPAASTPAPQGSPTPQAASASAGSSPVTSQQGLKSLALNETDLAQYTLAREGSLDTNGVFSVASYFGNWEAKSPQRGAALLLSNVLITGFTPDQARGLVANEISGFANDPANSNVQHPAVSALGDEAQGLTYNWSPAAGLTAQDYLVVFRRGRVVVGVLISGLPGGVSLDYAVSLAHVIDGRLAAVATTSSPLTGAATSHEATGGAAASGPNVWATLSAAKEVRLFSAAAQARR